MKIRTRLTLSLFMMGFLPVLLIAFGLSWTIINIRDLSIARSQQALEASGRQAIRAQAEVVARELSMYFQYHPELDPRDYPAIETNPDLMAIAVQPVGSTGYTAVHDRRGINHFHVNPSLVGTDLSTLSERLPQFWNLIAISMRGVAVEGYYDWLEPDGVTIRQKYMAIVPVPGTDLMVAATTYIDEFSAPAQTLSANVNRIVNRAIWTVVTTISISLLFAGVAGWYFSSRLVNPLGRLTEAAARVEQGDLEQQVVIERRDEMGQLASVFNLMTARIREMVGSLEERVRQRTAELETRASQLQAIAEVSRSIASIQEPSELLGHIAAQISQHFNVYHTGVFLLDEKEEYAVLQAASSEGGQRMLARGHRLKVGEVGIVGYVAGTGRPRIALDTGVDAVFFQNPDLPLTRSEIALPLKIGDRVIGVLDVQSSEPSAFSQSDIEVLSILADQVSIAIENARLFEETRRSLTEAEQLYRQFLRAEWARLPREQKLAGFRYSAEGVSLLERPLDDPEVKQVARTGKPILKPAGKKGEPGRLAVPIMLRGEVVGVVNVSAADGTWTQDDMDILTAVAERIALSAENARLFEETSRRAAKERTIAEVSARLGALVDIDNLLQTAAQEMSRNLPGAEVVIQFQQKAQGEN
jgi:GAF domain-containing protein/HAMP domain-containing protein